MLKLVRALPKLQILVMGLLKSMSSIGYIGLLLGLLFYLYGVLGVSLLGANDPVHMGNLHTAIIVSVPGTPVSAGRFAASGWPTCLEWPNPR